MVKDQWGSIWNVNHVATLSVSRKNTPIQFLCIKVTSTTNKGECRKEFWCRARTVRIPHTASCSPVQHCHKWTGSYIHLFTPIPALVSVLNCCLCNTHCDALESNLGLVSCPSRLEQSVVEPAAFWLVDDLVVCSERGWLTFIRSSLTWHWRTFDLSPCTSRCVVKLGNSHTCGRDSCSLDLGLNHEMKSVAEVRDQAYLKARVTVKIRLRL